MHAQLRNIVTTGILVVFAATAPAADPAITCQSSKLKTSAKYGSCRLNAEAKGLKTSSTPDFTKCDETASSKWQGAEDKAGLGVCPTEGDGATVAVRIAHHTDAIVTLLAGGVPVDPYYPATGQVTSYGLGDDGSVEAGATLAYRDNGDGTITDLNLGLMWEKKIGESSGLVGCASETGTCANPHKYNNRYEWSLGSSAYDGPPKTLFLEQLNHRCDQDTGITCTSDADCAAPGGPCGFAGHRDWRLPSMRELLTVLDYSRTLPRPLVNSAFFGASCGAACTDMGNPACSCDASDCHWSATTYTNVPTYAWYVDTTLGLTERAQKWGYGCALRAVRTGS